MRWTPTSFGSMLMESNDCHEPAGKPTGGQFCAKDGGLLTQQTLRAWADQQIASEPDLDVLDLRLHPSGAIDLEVIAMKRRHQGYGTGTKVMQRLVAFADQHGRRITLSLGQRGYQPVEGGVKTSSRGRLLKFYKRFGFVENTGRRKDFTLGMSTSMYRDPQGAV